MALGCDPSACVRGNRQYTYSIICAQLIDCHHHNNVRMLISRLCYCVQRKQYCWLVVVVVNCWPRSLFSGILWIIPVNVVCRARILLQPRKYDCGWVDRPARCVCEGWPPVCPCGSVHCTTSSTHIIHHHVILYSMHTLMLWHNAFIMLCDSMTQRSGMGWRVDGGCVGRLVECLD